MAKHRILVVDDCPEDCEFYGRFLDISHLIDIGIDPRDQERIFQPLERLHPQSAYPGTGLGLAQCRKILASHGGRIEADSAVGEGATFHLVFPNGCILPLPLAA